MTVATQSPTTSDVIDLTEASPKERTDPADLDRVSPSVRTEEMAKRLAFLKAFDEREFTSEIDELVDDPDLHRDL